MATARQTPLQVAAANWLALATYAGRFAPDGPALLLDIGSFVVVRIEVALPISILASEPSVGSGTQVQRDGQSSLLLHVGQG